MRILFSWCFYLVDLLFMYSHYTRYSFHDKNTVIGLFLRSIKLYLKGCKVWLILDFYVVVFFSQKSKRLTNMVSTFLSNDDAKTSMKTQIVSLGLNNPFALPVLNNYTDNTTVMGGNWHLYVQVRFGHGFWKLLLLNVKSYGHLVKVICITFSYTIILACIQIL